MKNLYNLFTKLFFLTTIFLSSQSMAITADDIDADVKGAQDTDMIGILVKTGKYLEKEIKNSNVKPDYIMDTFSHILNYI